MRVNQLRWYDLRCLSSEYDTVFASCLELCVFFLFFLSFISCPALVLTLTSPSSCAFPLLECQYPCHPGLEGGNLGGWYPWYPGGYPGNPGGGVPEGALGGSPGI